MGLPKRLDSKQFPLVVRWNARDGKMHRVDRKQDDVGNWATDLIDITKDFEAVMGMKNIEVGFIDFTSRPPDFRMVRLGGEVGECPGDNFKEGFRLRMRLLNGAGNDVREFSSTSKYVWQSLSELHDEYLEERVKHKDKLPVAGIAEVVQVRTTSSTFYRPIFEFLRWVKCPELTGGK